MLTRNVTAVREIPGEPGHKMTFRQLGWRQLAEAEEARSAAVLRNLRAMGGELMRELQGVNRDDVDQRAATETVADPLARYDQATVLQAGVADWTYPERLNRENLDSLDPDTARWAALEIIGLGKPPIGQEVEDRFFGSPGSLTATTPATQTIAATAVLSPAASTQNGSSL